MSEFTYFPIEIVYEDREYPEVLDDPEDIRCGVTFKILKTNGPVSGLKTIDLPMNKPEDGK